MNTIPPLLRGLTIDSPYLLPYVVLYCWYCDVCQTWKHHFQEQKDGKCLTCGSPVRLSDEYLEDFGEPDKL